MKASVVSLNYEEMVDAKTGRHTLRLTPKNRVCHRNYFYQKCFTKDGKKLLIAGDFDAPINYEIKDDFSSPLNYYLLDIASGQVTQLTEGVGDNTFGGFLSHDDKFLYYVKNKKNLQRVSLSNLAEETVFSSDDDWVAYGTWVANSTTTKIVGIEIHKDSYMDLNTWDAFAKMHASNPRCRLFSVDLGSGKQSVIHEENYWLGHPIYRPYDDNTVVFCHEGPHDLVHSRIWFINEDGTNLRMGNHQEEGEHCTHEFWVPNGSQMIYVSFSDRGCDRTICSVNSETGENKRIMSMPHCSHLMSNYDGSLLVGDGTCTPMDVVNPSACEIESDNDLYIFDMKNKSYESLVEHKSSWGVFQGSRQITHPHPSFSPDDTHVLWGSDFEGLPAIYLTRIAKD
jgi:oligogalacturonide lyase